MAYVARRLEAINRLWVIATLVLIRRINHKMNGIGLEGTGLMWPLVYMLGQPDCHEVLAQAAGLELPEPGRSYDVEVPIRSAGLEAHAAKGAEEVRDTFIGRIQAAGNLDPAAFALVLDSGADDEPAAA